MPTIKKFEDLRAWQSSRELVGIVYKLTNQGAFQKDFALRDQIRRAVISVMSNIAEGFGAGSDAEIIRFLGFSRRSLSETQSQLYTALDLEYITREEFDHAYKKGNETERQINAFIAYLNRAKSSRTVRDGRGAYALEIPDQPIDL
jgi:four helix bundle protein